MSRAIIVAIAAGCLLMSSTALAVAPPENDYPVPDRIKKAMQHIQETEKIDGIAELLQTVKQEKLEALRNGRSYPSAAVSGVVPVLLGNYSDEVHLFTANDFQENLFGNNPTGSMVDYYDEVSYGQFALSGTAYGPYTADSTKAYYAALDNGMDNTSYPRNAAGYIVSFLDDADPAIDFSQFDDDGPDGIPNSGDDDGYVDVVVIVFPGGGGNGPDPTNIWPHASRLTNMGGSEFVTNDAAHNGGFIKIDRYTVNPAESGDGSLDVISAIGVFCHEYGHILGLPDLYDSEYESRGIGDWGLMGYGGGGDSGKPAHMCAWSKAQLGWVIPIEINSTQSIDLPAVETTPTVYKLWADGFKGRDYFLLENRTATGFDVNIPGQGMVIWHINEKVLELHNAYNNPQTRLVDVVEADGHDDLDHLTGFGDIGDVFPGASNNTTFSDDTYPNAHDVNGDPTGLVIDNIAWVSGPGSDVTCDITPRENYGYTLTYHAGFLRAVYFGWGTTTPSVCYGAVKFVAGDAGKLYSVSAGARRHMPNSFQVRVYDDVSGDALTGLQSTTYGNYPDFMKMQYTRDIPLQKLDLSSGQSFVVDCSWGPDEYALPLTYTDYPISGNSYKSYEGVSYSVVVYYDLYLEAKVATNCPDPDGDGLCYFEDNCPTVYNPDQAVDSNGVPVACCCVVRGNADNQGGPGAELNVADLTFLVSFLFQGGPQPPCTAQGDVDGSGAINVADLTFLVKYFFQSGPPPPGC